jgi:hypothetical protein
MVGVVLRVVHVMMVRSSMDQIFTIDNEAYGMVRLRRVPPAPLGAAVFPPSHVGLRPQCYTPEDMVEKVRGLGDRFEFTLRKPYKMAP